MREWIINHEKYKHLFQGIGHLKCNPISIEMQEGSTPVRKPTRKVPLALHEKFKQEIDSTWSKLVYLSNSGDAHTRMASFVIVKKPNGNLKEFVWTLRT